jgi:hypothetical protein
MDEEATSKKRKSLKGEKNHKKSRRGRRTTKRNFF